MPWPIASLASSGIILGEVRYAVGLYDHAVRSAIAEGFANGIAAGQKAVRRNLRLAQHTTAQVMEEVHRAVGIPLPDAPANDGLLRSGHADESVLVALGVDLMALDVLLLLANEAPCLIKLQAIGADADHHAVVQFHAAHAGAQREAANSATVDAGQARGVRMPTPSQRAAMTSICFWRERFTKLILRVEGMAFGETLANQPCKAYICRMVIRVGCNHEALCRRRQQSKGK
jgi:hypothetical protein